ncbi:MAG: UDP-GlcNAc3NAcA epimerase [Polaribacter sp.]|jgi:UDP-GlcNAc3NAcA epimerase
MKIVTIIGARPQFIKAGTLSREIAKHKSIEEVIIHTGQHFDDNMSEIFFNQMRIPKPKYNLNINGNGHGAMTGQMLEKIEIVLKKEQPDWVVVYGDTNSTLAGALAASKLHIKIAHIEAGLRSFNIKMPEEVNRILTDRISDVLFCPTEIAINNLKKEGFPNIIANNYKQVVINVGDVMQDGAIYYEGLADKPNTKLKNKFVLTTIHRAENTDDIYRLTSIFQALSEISLKTQVILPVHPRTKEIILKNKLNIENITLIDPVGYLEMIWLIKNCTQILTDSGGLQKEAYFFKKPCITLRDETEWTELTDHKFNILAGAKKENIIEAFNNFEFNKDFSIDLFGGGNASAKIIETLLR